jgi:hypothetical protein
MKEDEMGGWGGTWQIRRRSTCGVLVGKREVKRPL